MINTVLDDSQIAIISMIVGIIIGYLSGAAGRRNAKRS